MHFLARTTLVAALAVAGPAAAFTNEAVLRITLVIPVQCQASITDASFNGAEELVVQVERSCNTWHSIVLSGGDSNVQIRELASGRSVNGTRGYFPQGRRFIDGQATYVISAAPEALQDFASALSVEVDAT